VRDERTATVVSPSRYDVIPVSSPVSDDGRAAVVESP
jgi:hypothetical protein